MARVSSRNLWKAKIEGKLPSSNGLDAAAAAMVVRGQFHGGVLGIDPSLRGTGLAVLEFSKRKQPVLLHSRTVRMKASKTMPECLAEIYRSIEAVLNLYRIDHVALEQTIYVQNFQTAQILGAARGAAITAAAIRELKVFEYPPLRVKQAVVGIGRASKEQVAKTVMGILGHGAQLASDEADAAGVALCHAFTWRPPPGR